VDEIIRILEGEALIEVDGKFRQIGPGDTVFFPLGQTVRWEVPKYVRKVFFKRRPSKVVEIIRSFKILGACVLGLLSDGAIPGLCS
jgi:mannose-6-phosphate isomerase-like protein (cupin superfamily)